ncbi:hypothetical protein OESDEN_12659 [Oesophagostomum dentatum]|uniref:Uncharacterized protein n=1 Tax=Oesophagostomum dentatum TaxID=61180 RepID=A0A0B1SRJ7_OESDE|nr:hypothetical protein OESDEN_12659 [Oesophagostomum dentatum]
MDLIGAAFRSDLIGAIASKRCHLGFTTFSTFLSSDSLYL